MTLDVIFYIFQRRIQKKNDKVGQSKIRGTYVRVGALLSQHI